MEMIVITLLIIAIFLCFTINIPMGFEKSRTAGVLWILWTIFLIGLFILNLIKLFQQQ